MILGSRGVYTFDPCLKASNYFWYKSIIGGAKCLPLLFMSGLIFIIVGHNQTTFWRFWWFITEGWAINLAKGPLLEGRVLRRAMPSSENRSKSLTRLPQH